MSEGPALADAYLPVSFIESEQPVLGNSELARLMRAFDWDITSFSPSTLASSRRSSTIVRMTDIETYLSALRW